MNDAEDATVVLASVIGAERLSVANAPLLPGMRVHERVEATVQIDVVRDEHAARLQGTPRVFQLEQQVSLGMPAVVYEQVDLSELSKKLLDAAPAGSANVRPAITKAHGHGRADLRMQVFVPRRRKVDAPEMTSPVSRQSFEDEARS